jgi:hypothetical protein
MRNITLGIISLIFLISACRSKDFNGNDDGSFHQLYKISDSETRWSSFENLTAEKGKGATANKGAKGHPCEAIQPGQSVTVLDIEGPGLINRIWATITPKTPDMLRLLRIEIFWDGCEKPAVSAPFGDFFGISLGQMTSFENELFAEPEGKSFNCFVPMPFKKRAKVVVTNESDFLLKRFFFDINFLKLKKWDRNSLYFHCYWHRDTATTVGQDYKILPRIRGKGRFLGTNIGVVTNPVYGNHWWGEGEVKMYIDGDSDFPSLVGTGTEDYIGTGWGLGVFACRYFGSLVADREKGRYCFYRYHIPDPVFFSSDIEVTIQQMGHTGSHEGRLELARKMKEGVPAIPVTITEGVKFHLLLEQEGTVDITDIRLPSGPVKYFRSDDVSSTAYFYLDRPENDLLPIQLLELRTYKLN